MVISWAPGESGWSLPRDKWAGVQESVKLLHEIGVTHGDLGPDNLKYDSCSGKVYIFDFGQATLRKAVSEERFERACLEDFEDLDRWFHFQSPAKTL